MIADYLLPGWSGLRALNMMQERAIDLPFIIVSGAIGEETAVDAMKSGAHDYVLKDNVVRLVPAIERERREAGLRRERRQALAALEKLAERSALLAAVSRRLAGSLDHDETLEAAARACVPEVADWCVLTVLDEEPRPPRAVLWHAQPELAGHRPRAPGPAGPRPAERAGGGPGDPHRPGDLHRRGQRAGHAGRERRPDGGGPARPRQQPLCPARRAQRPAGGAHPRAERDPGRPSIPRTSASPRSWRRGWRWPSTAPSSTGRPSWPSSPATSSSRWPPTS